MMEWHFYKADHIIPLHEHYHVQLSYIVKGSAKVILADGSEKPARRETQQHLLRMKLTA